MRYVEADTEFARYGLGSTAEQAALLRSFVEPDLVVLDDLFLARRISEASAELLQTVVHQRYKQRRSIVVTSPCRARLGQYLGDATMATTILDRLCTARPCWSSRARAIASRRRPRASR